MRENLFSYIRAEGCCTKCKCEWRKSRANLFAHDRAQHLVLKRSESTEVREQSSGSCRERRTHQARYTERNYRQGRSSPEGSAIISQQDKCVGRESRANLFAHDRAQHLVLKRSESTEVRQWRSGSCRECRTHQARYTARYHFKK